MTLTWRQPSRHHEEIGGAIALVLIIETGRASRFHRLGVLSPAILRAIFSIRAVTNRSAKSGYVEPAWTLLTFESLRALRREPSAAQTAIRIANDLSVGEIAGSPVARNTLILLRRAIERGGLPLTATGNLSRTVVAEMCKLIEWPDYDQADAFRFNKVINEPDFLPL